MSDAAWKEHCAIEIKQMECEEVLVYHRAGGKQNLEIVEFIYGTVQSISS